MSVTRVTISGVCLGQTMQNVIHFLNPDDSVSLPAVCVDIRDNWLNSMSNCSTSSFAYTLVKAETVGTSTPPSPATLAVAVGGVGTPTTNHVVLCFIFKLRTQIGGRRGRGRIYVMAPRADWIANSVPTGAGSAFMTGTVIPALMARYGPSGVSPLILGVASREDPTDCKPIESIAVASYMGVQRRRNIGVGI